uniref:vomeronasal type-2 receptor 26-like n=1 Tax=Euleptes europaea TaxID=460621 RepID=UPI00253FB418|nr:vomeronasal type-2 receptor 26-like [Euleptes europaea]
MAGKRRVKIYHRRMLTKFYQHTLVLAFAVYEINESPKILPNVSLGFHIYDSYYDEKMTYRTTLDLLYKLHRYFPNYECDTHKNLMAVIGGLGADISLRMADILGLYKIPQLTYGSFASEKRETRQSPSFYHMVPNEDQQYMGIVRLLQHFGWMWVGLCAVDDDSGEHFGQVLESLLPQYGICLAFTESIPNNSKWDSLTDVNYFLSSMYSLLTEGKVRTYILYGESRTITAFIDLRFLVISGSQEKATFRKVWITTAQIDFGVTGLQRSWDFHFLHGAISFTIHSKELSGFQKFLQNRKPNWEQGFLKDFWEQAFDCFFPELQDLMKDNGTCTGEEKLESLPSTLYEMAVTGHSYSIYNAVHAVAHALNFMITSRSQQTARAGHQSAELQEPWKVPPVSVCNDYCHPGAHKRKKEGEKFCCYDCVSCPEGKVSKEMDMDDCIKCPDDQYASEDSVRCIPKTISFLSYEEPLGIIMASVAAFYSLITVFVLGTTIKHRHTPIVKANNQDITYTLLISLLLCFLCSLLFIGEPSKVTCFLRQFAFGIIFTVAVSCVLAKTITVVVAFMATKPGSRIRKWVGKRLTNSILLSCSLIQLCICMIWLGTSPPFPVTDMKSLTREVTVECNEGSVLMFYIVLGYMGLLSIISLTVAFFARKLPDSFNEAKFICFSMLIFCCVWLSFVPSYLSTKGKYTVAVEVRRKNMLIKYYQHNLALAFAVNEINKNTQILPNATLGFHIYDSYFDMKMTSRTTLDLLFKSQRFLPNYKCDSQKNVIAVVGGLGADTSFHMADILRLYKMPQV